MSVNYLVKTKILDFDNHNIQSLITERNWKALDDYNKIGAAYTFVKDEIKFGYNRSDDITASEVLADGYGQCNTKGNLLMALLRALNIECRFHGFTIDQQLQKGAIPSYVFWLAPKYIIHSWVEVFFDGKWVNLEGFILDDAYLSSIQSKFSRFKDNFCGYGIATICLENPMTEWVGKSTYIQKEGIHDDFGLYNSPDVFYSEKGTNLSGVKRWLYQSVIRHIINMNVNRLRNTCNQGSDKNAQPQS
ncbi:transglutaminase-like domain-containing protein [Thalassomonas sp. M1454]|uniref:transglutaminase-like domain-containing protein n=1 Tax=Thalassomonas sp. M1454 TaxID=2594477 RepID=UPI00117D2FD3|nr:transglutaminase-like domain-containing protein [Thalassomonas sp. M1454]TRX57962.1 transglutaminase domain-containing protein [Thalassomonas sp. M1454]